MNHEVVSRWVQTSANVGILIGLALVGMQIHQSTEIAKAQIISDMYLADQQFELAMMGEHPQESWAKAVFQPESMTKEDAVVVDRYINYTFIQLRRLGRMRDFGLVDDFDREVTAVGWQLGFPVGRRWWDYAKSQENMWGVKRFAAQVDSVLKSSNPNENRDAICALIAGSASAAASCPSQR